MAAIFAEKVCGILVELVIQAWKLVQVFPLDHFTSKYIELVEISRWRLFSQMGITLVDEVKLYELG